MGRFILKSKNAEFVRDSGLIPNQACYELVKLVQNQGGNQGTSQIGSKQPTRSAIDRKSYIATIRSVNKHLWTGKMSVVDHNFSKSYIGSKINN